MNTTYHCAINMMPYELVFHMKVKRKLRCIRPWSLKKAQESRKDKKLKNHRKATIPKWSESEINLRKKLYKVDDMVSIKIDGVDKKSSFHPNILLRKVLETENNYVKVVTPFGRIKGFITPSRLFSCTATNVKLDCEKEISFTGACKLAENAQ